jgi:hypothetical protein
MDAWMDLIGSYEDPGVLGRLAEKVHKISVGKDEMKRILKEDVARACEMAYVAYLLEETLLFHQKDARDINEKELWKAVAKVTSHIFYDHVADYPPAFGQVLRGTGFSDYDHIKGTYWEDGKLRVGEPFTRDEILEIGLERFAWLETYLRHIFLTKTSYKDLPEDIKDIHFGNHEKNLFPAGTRGQNELEDKWFRITQLREIAFYRGEHLPIAEALKIKPKTIKSHQRVTESYLAPLYRQHMVAGVAEGPTLQKIAPVNVMVTRGVKEVKVKGKKESVYVIESAYMFLSKDEFIEAYMETYPGTAEFFCQIDLKRVACLPSGRHNCF